MPVILFNEEYPHSVLALHPTACKDEQKSSESLQDDMVMNNITEKRAEPDSGTTQEGGVIVKNNKKSKKLKTNVQHAGEDETHGDHQTDGGKAELKQKCSRATSGVESSQTSTEVKVLVQSSADHTSEMTGLPVEAPQAECVTSPIKKKNIKMNVKKEKTVEDTSEQIVEKLPEDASQLEVSTTVRKKKKSRNQCLSLQDIREEVAVCSLPAEDDANEEIRKLSTRQKMNREDNETRRQLGSVTSQKKVKRKKRMSCLQEAEIAVKSPEMSRDSEEQTDEMNRHPCPMSVEENMLQCKQESITKKKKIKKLLPSSQVMHSVSADGCNEGRDAVPAEGMMSSEAEQSEARVLRTKSSTKKVKEISGSKIELGLGVGDPELISDGMNITVTEKKSDAQSSQVTFVKKAKKKAEKQPESKTHTHTLCKMKKVQKRQKPAAQLREEPSQMVNTDKEVSETVPSDISSLTPIKRGKKKRKLQTDKAETSLYNGHADEELHTKKVKSSVSLYIYIINTTF